MQAHLELVDSGCVSTAAALQFGEVDYGERGTSAGGGLGGLKESERNLMIQEIARHQSRLRAFLRCLLVRSSDVDDLLQEINVVLWEKADEFTLGTDFWAWASQIARFQVWNWSWREICDDQ